MPTDEPPSDCPMPDLSRYDATELNEAAAMVMSEIGWLPFSKRYRMAAALLDARGRRRVLRPPAPPPPPPDRPPSGAVSW